MDLKSLTISAARSLVEKGELSAEELRQQFLALAKAENREDAQRAEEAILPRLRDVPST